MAVEQPVAGDPLDTPSHSLMHRIVAIDASAPVKSITVIANGNVAVGHDAPDTAFDIDGALTLREVSADPSTPDEGTMAMWMSDGTETGEDGDVILKTYANSVSKLVNLTARDSSMARQALINGNFDIWQRATTVTNPASNIYHTADRWRTWYLVDGGTLPTNIVISRQAITPGDLPKSYYHLRIAPDGAGSGFGADAYYNMSQRIENGTRYLCGAGKKVTLSFWAKSSIASKKIGVWLNQNYGSGGTPTGSESIAGANWTLTSSWVKYTHTFTTNTLASKTFGTDLNDFLDIRFAFMWGTNMDDEVGATGAEDFVGSGNIDIAQVQVNSGDIALDFNPMSFQEELERCYRYCQVKEDEILMTCFCTANNAVMGCCHLANPMRTTPTLTATAADWVILYGAGSSVNCSSMSIGATSSGKNGVQLVAGVATTPFTVGQGCVVRFDATTGRKFILDAEV